MVSVRFTKRIFQFGKLHLKPQVKSESLMLAGLKLFIFRFFVIWHGTGTDYHCSKVDYFPHEEYSPDPNDSTMAIPCKCLAVSLKRFDSELSRFRRELGHNSPTEAVPEKVNVKK